MLKAHHTHQGCFGCGLGQLAKIWETTAWLWMAGYRTIVESSLIGYNGPCSLC